jgi:hypothetical protein
VIQAAQRCKVDGEVRRLWAHMASQAVAGEVTVTVAAWPGKPERTAQLQVWSGQVTLQPPLRPPDHPRVWFEPLSVWAIS